MVAETSTALVLGMYFDLEAFNRSLKLEFETHLQKLYVDSIEVVGILRGIVEHTVTCSEEVVMNLA